MQVEEKTERIITGEKRKNPFKDNKKARSESPQRKLQKTHEGSERNLHSLSPSPKRADVIRDNSKDDEEIFNEKAEASNEKISLNKPNSTEHDVAENISMSDVKRIIMDLFLVEMPEDFFQFYEFCKSISKDNPLSVCKSVRLKLVGPYDVLDGKIKMFLSENDKEAYLTHWRYYYDPPEFQVHNINSYLQTIYNINKYFRYLDLTQELYFTDYCEM